MYFLSTKELRSYLSYFIFSTFGINWYWYGDEICMVGLDKSKTILWCDSIGLSTADPIEKYCKKLVLTVGMSPIAAGSIGILVCVLIGRYTRINHFTSMTTTSKRSEESNKIEYQQQPQQQQQSRSYRGGGGRWRTGNWGTNVDNE